MYKLKHLSKTTKNAILFVFLGVLVCASFLFALHAWENRQYRLNIGEESPYRDAGQAILYLDGKTYRERKHLETILLIGLDKFDSGSQDEEDTYSNHQQSDFLMLMVIDRDAGRYVPLHVNRDSMAPVRVLGAGGRTVGTVTEQLALSHTYGSGGTDSCRNTVKAVSDLLYGIHIDHYVSFTMDAVVELNDLVGGATVKILDDFSAVDPSLVQGETICLNGEQALHFVRARGEMEDSSNLARMERQRQYLYALQKKTLRCLEKDEDFTARVVAKLSEHLVSDCSLNQLANLVTGAQEYEMADFEDLPGEAIKGKEFMEFYLDERATKELVTRLFFEPYEE